MATRSTITVKLTENKYAQIYCHYDGYLDHNGQILYKHYNSLELATELIKLGDLSVLQPRMHPTTSDHTFSTPEPGVCIAYGRDRGEANTEAEIKYAINGKYDSHHDHDYLFDDGEWYLNGVLLSTRLGL